MKKAILVIALLAAVPSASLAGDPLFDAPDDEEDKPLKTSVFVYPLVESYRWNEFFNGGQVEENEGTLYGAGAIVTFESGRALYRIRGDYFQGELEAEGVTQSGFSWATDISLWGFRLEGDGAWRFPVGKGSIAPVMGLGYRWWRRDYENSTTVEGGLEKWHTVYLKFGALGEYPLGESIAPYAEAGVRLGVFNNNEIDFNGMRISLDPGGRLTPYAELGIKAGFLKMAGYYERMEFSQSSGEWAPGIPPGWGLVQPEITANIFGARVGIIF